MNLTLFFRLIMMSIFQKQVTCNHFTKGFARFEPEEMDYDNTLFYCPIVFAKDGFHVSLQIHHGNYCSSENGYRMLGHTMEKVEFGSPSENEELLHEYSEMYGANEDETFDVTGKVGSIPVEILEKVFEKHGGIDWDKTISIDFFNARIKS